MTTAREFIKKALDEIDPEWFELALSLLGDFLGKGRSYFLSFPDADVGEDADTVKFQEYWDAYWCPQYEGGTHG